MSLPLPTLVYTARSILKNIFTLCYLRSFRRRCCRLIAIASLLAYVAWLLHHAAPFAKPSQDGPVLIWATETSDELKRHLLEAIKSAEHSILLSIYTLNDPAIIAQLAAKARANISVEIRHDEQATANLETLIPYAVIKKERRAGLFHDKILVIDKCKVWIGSANFTPNSLLLDYNLLLALHDEKLACAIEKRASYSAPNYIYYPLGECKELALNYLLNLIQRSQHSIRGSIFVLTHPLIIEALIEAKNRGVVIELVSDWKMVMGAGRAAAQKLNDHGIKLATHGSKNSTFHHKWFLIDETTLVAGSTNLTRAGFEKNGECFFVLTHLNSKQKKKLTKIHHASLRCSG